MFATACSRSARPLGGQPAASRPIYRPILS
jgi:hypothetical protein